MNTKTMIAALVGAIATFLLGWAVWGILLMDYYKTNMVHYEGLMLPDAEFKLWAMFIANLASALLYAWLFTRMNVRTLASGAQTGAIINLLFALSLNMSFYSMMNWYSNTTVIIVDILINAVFGAIIGAIIAMMLGRGEKTATA